MILLSLFLLSACPCDGSFVSGKVSHVVDGDTLDVDAGFPLRVRIWGIDAPELSQPHGRTSRRFLSRLVLNRVVSLNIVSRDAHGRCVAKVSLDRLSVGVALVLSGHAWHFKRFSYDPLLSMSENEARDEKRGLWSDTAPMPPWEYRAANK